MTDIITGGHGDCYCTGCGERACSPSGRSPGGNCPDDTPHDWQPGLGVKSCLCCGTVLNASDPDLCETCDLHCETRDLAPHAHLR